MSEFHDPFPNYEMLAHHDEDHGKKIRKKLWMVFGLLLVVTIVELIIGFFWLDWHWPKMALKIIFIGLTIVKAGYIVLVFMHLGDEKKTMRWMILGPFSLFILYFIFMCVMGEGNYSNDQRALKWDTKSDLEAYRHEHHNVHAPEPAEEGGGEHK